MSVDACPTCGFEWSRVPDEALASRICSGAERLGEVVATGSSAVTSRPLPEVWSPLEYGAHTRDVLLLMRDRIVVALNSENPSFTMMHPDQRVDAGLYRNDTPSLVASDLTTAADLLVRFAGALSDSDLSRPCQYVWPEPETRSIRWMLQQVVHELEHHTADANHGLALNANQSHIETELEPTGESPSGGPT